MLIIDKEKKEAVKITKHGVKVISGKKKLKKAIKKQQKKNRRKWMQEMD